MIVVTTPTGKIGSKLVEELVSAKKPVRVIARDPTKLPPELRDNVEVVKGSSDDQIVLLKAFEGADSVFWVVPPSFSANNDEEYYLKLTQPACQAIKERGVKRVIAVSSWDGACRSRRGQSQRHLPRMQRLEDRRRLPCSVVPRIYGEHA